MTEKAVVCLCIPARVIERLAENRARVEVGGEVRVVSLAGAGDVAVGDFVVIQGEVALSRLSQEEAEEAMELIGSHPPR